MSRPADKDHNDFKEQRAEFYYLRGHTPEQIAGLLGIGRSSAMRLISPIRKLMAAGQYDTELAVLREQGFTNVPSSATAYGKVGRPVQPFTEQELAMRADFAGGMSLAAVAKKYSTSRQRLRYTLKKQPIDCPTRE